MTKLSPGEICRSLRIATWEGSFEAVHANLVNSAFLTGFALTWGANDFLLGLFGAIPFLAAPGQLLGAYLVDRWASRRREMVALLGFDRVAARTFPQCRRIRTSSGELRSRKIIARQQA